MTQIDPRHARSHRRAADRRADRRGNAMVLVAGLLVLLVIVVAAFLTSARGTRELAAAQKERAIRDASVDDIATTLADEIAGALFARPIDATGVGNPAEIASSVDREQAFAELRDGNRLRLEPLSDARRQSTDWDADEDGRPDTTWNTVPHQVVPWTNWPDNLAPLPGSVALYPEEEEVLWPAGPGFPTNGPWRRDPGAGFGAFPVPELATNFTETNPIGDPGTNDSRWLADAEPMRWDIVPGSSNFSGVDGFPHAFRMWRHLSYIGRPGNGWRVVSDISNVTGNLVTNLRYPVEQWLTDVVPTPFFDETTGFARWEWDGSDPDLGASYNRWQDWFFRYPYVYADPARIPHNFFRLDDADADGEYDPPADSFRFGTPRWDLNRVLDDADGDGFTDSFWWLAPIQGPDGLRYVVSFRIVDNAAKVNANVATRFEPGLAPGPGDELATRGETPADVALVGRPDLAPPVSLPMRSDRNVGLLDNPLRRDSSGALLRRGWWLPNNPSVDLYDSRGGGVSDVSWGGNTDLEALQQWRDFVRELRVPITPVEDAFRFTDDRRLYFNAAASRPNDPGFGISPFGVEDEIELRLFHGNNFTWTFSRFERALNRPFNLDEEPFGQILRSSRTYQESSGFLSPGENFKLDAYELAHDTRHRLTLFNGARNDLKPAWLRWRGALPQRIYETTRTLPNQDRLREIDRFLAQAARKMDLRENDAGRVLRDEAESTDFVPRGPLDARGERFLHERLAEEIFLALVETDRTGELSPTESASYESIFGSGTVQGGDVGLRRVARVSAALAANILSRRDDDRDRMEVDPLDRFNVAPLYDEIRETGQAGAIPIPAWPDNFRLDTATVPPLERPTFDRDRDRRMLGLEPQPFLTEAMVTLVHGGSEIRQPPAGVSLPFYEGPSGTGGGGSSGPWFAFSTDPDAGSEGQAVLALQMANPFHHVIPWRELSKYGLRLFGEDVRLRDLFAAAGFPVTAWDAATDPIDRWDFFPSADDNPVTLTILIVDETFSWQRRRNVEGNPSGPPSSIADFRARWLDFLGLEQTLPGSFASDESMTLVLPWSEIPGLTGVPSEFYQDSDGGDGGLGGGGGGGSEEALIELWRETYHDRADAPAANVSENAPPFDPATAAPTELVDRVVLDRFGMPESAFRTALFELEPPPDHDVDLVPAGSGGSFSKWAGIRIQDEPILMQPVTVRRAWSRDLDATPSGTLVPENVGFSPADHGPRYVVAQERVFGPQQYLEAIPSGQQSGDQFTRAKPTFRGDDGDGTGYQGWAVNLVTPSEPTDSPLPQAGTSAGEAEETWFWEFIPHPYGYEDPTSLPEGATDLVGRRPVYFDGARDPRFADVDFLLTAAEEAVAAAGGSLSPDNLRLLDRGLWKGDFGTVDGAFQMLQKEGDYQQVGELLLTFAVAHELEFSGDRYVGTAQTFAEAMADDETTPADRGIFIGRLVGGRIIGDAPASARYDSENRLHSVPELAAGFRLLSAFVCDGPGVNWDPSVPGALSWEQVAFSNAAGFTGRATPGLVNLNTASPEVLAALPHWTTLAHFDEDLFAATNAVPHAVLAYRERYDNFARAEAGLVNLASHGVPGGPDYTGRPSDGRGERGFADIGELLQMDRGGRRDYPTPGIDALRGNDLNAIGTPQQVEDQLRAIRYLEDAWRIGWAAREPFRQPSGGWLDTYHGTRLSIDVNQPDRTLLRSLAASPDVDEFLRQEGDPAAGDLEEQRMLFSGASNLITTTSDMFTVYFRVRAFRPRDDGVLDATDLDAVASDRRYVMLVDRSQVNTPIDAPRIVFLQEVPD